MYNDYESHDDDRNLLFHQESAYVDFLSDGNVDNITDALNDTDVDDYAYDDILEAVNNLENTMLTKAGMYKVYLSKGHEAGQLKYLSHDEMIHRYPRFHKWHTDDSERIVHP